MEKSLLDTAHSHWLNRSNLLLSIDCDEFVRARELECFPRNFIAQLHQSRHSIDGFIDEVQFIDIFAEEKLEIATSCWFEPTNPRECKFYRM